MSVCINEHLCYNSSNDKRLITMISLQSFGNDFDGSPKVKQVYYLSLIPSNLITAGRFPVSKWAQICRSQSRKQLNDCSQSIVSVIKGLTPRTGRQTNWNLLEMGTPSIALVFTMQERAVDMINLLNKQEIDMKYQHNGLAPIVLAKQGYSIKWLVILAACLLATSIS